MSKVQHDGTLTAVQRPDEDTAVLAAVLAGFVDLVCRTRGQHVSRLTMAALWWARRAGLVGAEMLPTLATCSISALPPHVRTAIEHGSRQSGRLTCCDVISVLTVDYDGRSSAGVGGAVGPEGKAYGWLGTVCTQVRAHFLT